MFRQRPQLPRAQIGPELAWAVRAYGAKICFLGHSPRGMQPSYEALRDRGRDVGGAGVRWNAGTAVVGVDTRGETPCMLLRMDTGQWDTKWDTMHKGHKLQVTPHIMAVTNSRE